MHFQNLNTKGLSVVIVTYNGADKIKPTLMHLASQRGIDFSWEVILVDNNSTDQTGIIATQYWESLNTNNVSLKVIQEKKPGTMHARYKGMLAAGYRYLLYVDDDNRLSEFYLKTAFDMISADESIAAVGGKGIMEPEQGFETPAWIFRHENNFGCGAQGRKDGDTTFDKGCLYTGGAIFDRQWLNKLYCLGFVSALKGRAGKGLIAGEDTELTYALKLIGGRLHYSSKMHFNHYMPARRLNWAHLKKLWFAFGYSDFVLYPYLIFLKKKYNRFWTKRFYQWLKVLTICPIKIAFNGFRQGNISTLRLYRTLGEIRAFATNMKFFRASKKNIQTLTRAVTKANLIEKKH